MIKRKYFSWTDEKRAELREYVDTHEKPKKEAMFEAAELFGVSISSCYCAYNYEPKKPIVTEVDPADLEPRESRIIKTKSKVKMETTIDIDQSSLNQIKLLEHKLNQANKEQEEMLAEIKKWINLFPNAFTQLEFETGEITLDDVMYHANLILKIMQHKYGNKASKG
jgi:hypothetical protein